MSRKTEIEIEIMENGQVKFHVRGRKGPSCLEFLDVMSKKLGKVVNRELTSEYYEKAESDAHIEVSGDSK